MIVRIYTGHDGQTHFEDLPLPAEERHNVALQVGANLVFRCFPADYWSDWHTAPRRQYIFILVGQMEIGIGDGTTRRFGPGDVVLADDLTGRGHTTRSLGVPRISATVAVDAYRGSCPPSTYKDIHGTSGHDARFHHRCQALWYYAGIGQLAADDEGNGCIGDRGLIPGDRKQPSLGLRRAYG